MKEAKHKRPHTDFIFGIPRKGKFTEPESVIKEPGMGGRVGRWETAGVRVLLFEIIKSSGNG